MFPGDFDGPKTKIRAFAKMEELARFEQRHKGCQWTGKYHVAHHSAQFMAAVLSMAKAGEANEGRLIFDELDLGFPPLLNQSASTRSKPGSSVEMGDDPETVRGGKN